MRKTNTWLIVLVLLLTLGGIRAFAQANSELTGIVTDTTGAVVPEASIVLTDPATSYTRATTSGSTGLYDFAGLNPGNYNLTVTAKGFKVYEKKGIVVNVSGTFRADVQLTIGAETTTVTVEADALTVQTDSNVVSTLITAEDITSLATENRNLVALASLGMGVSSELPDNNSLGAFGSSSALEFNGLRTTHNIWLIDGGESDDRGGGGGMQIQPSQDAIAEFNMMTSNYPPDYGISSGATISMSLKSGTRDFHGAAWEENRATAYNANTWLDKQSSPVTPRPATHYNIYGFNVGGPIYIPHVYNSNRNKAFFFFNQEWRKTSGVTSSDEPTMDPKDLPIASNITTVGGVTGLQYVVPSYMPSSFPGLVVPAVALTSDYYINKLQPLGLVPGQPFPNNVIPESLFDGGSITGNAATYLTSVLPAANGPAADPDSTIATVAIPQKVEDTVVRGDYNINDKWALLVHYIGDHQNQTYGQPELGWPTSNYRTLQSILASPAHSATAKLTGAIKPNLLLEVSMNYDGNGADIVPSANTSLPSSWNVAPVVKAYTIGRKIWPGMLWDSSLPCGCSNANGGVQEDTGTEPYHNAAQDYEPKVDVSYTTGKHQLKFGFSYNRYSKNQMLYGDAQGQYTWAQLTNDTLMDTLLGIPSQYTQPQSAPIRHYYNQTPSVYAQDNWHITPRLSLQLGLRYDAMPQAVERGNLLGNFNQAAYQTGASDAPVWNADGTINASSPTLYTYNGIQSYINGTGLAGYEGVPRGVVTNDYRTLQPRVGFSDDLFGNGKTVLRGGFGTFYERFQGNAVFNVATSAPFNPQLTVHNTYFSTPGTNYNTGVAISPSSLIFASSAGSMAQDFRAPAAAMYSLGVQRELTQSVIWVVQYVGNIQWHQNIIDNALGSLPTNVGLVDIGLNDYPTACTTPSATCVDARQVAGDSGGKYGSDAKTSFANIAGVNAYVSYPGYSSVAQDENVATGTYNGLQSAVRFQNRWGLSAEVDYTYSHQIDIQSADRNNVDNPWYIKYDKGSGSYDRRQILNANYVYNLPIFNKSQGLLHSIAGGWQIAGTFVKETGIPQQVNLSASYDPVGLNGGYTSHPNMTPGGKLAYPKKASQWFDTSRIDNNITPVWAGGTNLGFGNWNKDALVLPGRFNLTTSLYKNFQIHEQVGFQLKFESFNTLNHTEWNAVNTSSGAINGTQDPRNLQLAGKITF